jgi:formylglycine-generating enzyme required for sulfatase activity
MPNIDRKSGKEKKPHQVFISYRNDENVGGADRKTAELICKTLESHGITCWIAPRDIMSGKDWTDAISLAINQAKLLLVVLSSRSEKSRFVKREVNLADDKEVPIIPFCIEEIKLQGGLGLVLKNHQLFNAYPGPVQNHLKPLVQDVCAHLGIKNNQPLYPKESSTDLKKAEEPNKPTSKKISDPKRYKKKESSLQSTSPKEKTQIKFLEQDLEPVSKKAKRRYLNEKKHWETEFGEDIFMIHIPMGEFIMGSDEAEDDQKPEHKVFLSSYWIGRYPVTFDQYDWYCKETGKTKPDDKGWGRGNRPVIRVTWHDAMEFCQWISKKTGLEFALPTEAQWEKAARGTEGLKYPWGEEFNPKNCNILESALRKTTPVTNHSKDSSPYGCCDMAGNVWEWCQDFYHSHYYREEEYHNPTGPKQGAYRVLRGGSWNYSSEYCQTTCRMNFQPEKNFSNAGFRLAIIFKNLIL